MQLVAEVGAQCVNVEPRIISCQLQGTAAQKVLGNVDAQVARRPHGFEQQTHLAAGAATQLDQVCFGAGNLRYVVGRQAEYQLLGARRVVLGLLGYLFEEFRPAAIVEKFWRSPFGSRGKARQNFVAKGGGAVM